MSDKEIASKEPNVFAVLKPYAWLLFAVTLFAILSSGLNLLMPKVIASGIDTFSNGTLVLRTIVIEFLLLAVGTFIFAYLQTFSQTYLSEKIARDLRSKIIAKISNQTYSYIQEVTASKLLTNLTSDIDAIKMFAGQATVTIISSVFMIVGGATLLILINWRLALVVLCILPLVGVAFGVVFSKMGPLFKKSQAVIDWLNKVINESVMGSAVIRVLNSQIPEYNKFIEANTEAKTIGLQVLRLFATVIPIIGFVANLAILSILLLGGHFVISSQMTLGNFTAFTNYLSILIFPIIMIGFMSSTISRASASYGRISQTLNADEKISAGTLTAKLRGDVDVQHVSLSLEGQPILKDVSLSAKAGKRMAILGPTAAGKTHLLYLLIGLLEPTEGEIQFDGKPLREYNRNSLHEQIGFVFQDSILFNLTIRENIAFSSSATDEEIQKAIDTAELSDFIGALPQGLNTLASERGTRLSGGQKQRIMLARALAINPKILLLDDFTARVDSNTEKKILANIEKNYPEITLISVTQKIASVMHYEQIVLLMEGEVLAAGTHEELMEKSPEYVQIFDSQKSTNHLEEENS